MTSSPNWCLCVLVAVISGCASDIFVCAFRGVCVYAHACVYVREREKTREAKVLSAFFFFVHHYSDGLRFSHLVCSRKEQRQRRPCKLRGEKKSVSSPFPFHNDSLLIL